MTLMNVLIWKTILDNVYMKNLFKINYLRENAISRTLCGLCLNAQASMNPTEMFSLLKLIL